MAATSEAPDIKPTQIVVTRLNRIAIYLAIIAGVIILFYPTVTSTLRSVTFKAPAIKALHTATITSTAPIMATTKYTAAEERQWDSLAEGMDRYHAHFRYEFDRVYKLADGGFHKEGMTLPRFLREAQQLEQHLDMHHRIETYIFPKLAKRMPQFKAGSREGGEHLKSHKQIHDGLDKYGDFLKASLANQSSYSPQTLREIMDGFREVLYRHLDEEVHDLGAASMKAAGWSLAELRQIPM